MCLCCGYLDDGAAALRTCKPLMHAWRMKHAVMTVAVDAVGTVKQKAKQQMHLTGGSGKATAFQVWRWVALLMIIGSTLPVGMWGLLAGFGGFIRIHQGSSYNWLTQGVEHLIELNAEEYDAQCIGRRVYMYELPPQFNVDVLQMFCLEKNDFLHMCESFINGGFGLRMEHVMDPVEAWYRTEQFALEAIVHERFKHYSCLTNNPDAADLLYLPYYVGLDLVITLYSEEMQLRDLLVERFFGWLLAQPSWVNSQGNNHLIILGRIIWDFSRQVETSGWGNSLLASHELRNLTKILIERDPYTTDKKQMAIPYPTSFHPGSDMELELWQRKVTKSKRDVLVSFAGGRRNVTAKPEMAIRDILFEQCTNSERCSTLLCTSQLDCPKNPHFITNLFLSSTFCFQPPGDSPTRKAVFDCLVAGSIPVFFNPNTAYTQYLWHLPADGSSYSVMIDEYEIFKTRENVIDILEKIPERKVKQMQAIIHKMIIPSIVYDMPGRDPNKKAKDAFDIALDHIFYSN